MSYGYCNKYAELYPSLTLFSKLSFLNKRSWLKSTRQLVRFKFFGEASYYLYLKIERELHICKYLICNFPF